MGQILWKLAGYFIKPNFKRACYDLSMNTFWFYPTAQGRWGLFGQHHQIISCHVETLSPGAPKLCYPFFLLFDPIVSKIGLPGRLLQSFFKQKVTKNCMNFFPFVKKRLNMKGYNFGSRKDNLEHKKAILTSVHPNSRIHNGIQWIASAWEDEFYDVISPKNITANFLKFCTFDSLMPVITFPSSNQSSYPDLILWGVGQKAPLPQATEISLKCPRQ